MRGDIEIGVGMYEKIILSWFQKSVNEVVEATSPILHTLA